MVRGRCCVYRPGEMSSPLYYLRFATRHNRGALSWTELITPNLICPSTYQLLRSSGGYSGPDMSFDKPASPERLFSLARASLAGSEVVDVSVGSSIRWRGLGCGLGGEGGPDVGVMGWRAVGAGLAILVVGRLAGVCDCWSGGFWGAVGYSRALGRGYDRGQSPPVMRGGLACGLFGFELCGGEGLVPRVGLGSNAMRALCGSGGGVPGDGFRVRLFLLAVCPYCAVVGCLVKDGLEGGGTVGFVKLGSQGSLVVWDSEHSVSTVGSEGCGWGLGAVVG
ncbi:hypothetical protein Tco_1541003 [Tanacetum coccineum]